MRLIDAAEVIKAVDKHAFETKDGLCLDDDISIILEDVPTIEERKTGKWIDGNKRQSCSVCCYRGVRSWSYCPCCGARMENER